MSLNLGLGFSEFNLRMHRSPGEGIYEFDDFRFDVGHLMLYHRGEPIPLAPKAAETLLALIERRGEIVSKDELIKRIWPDAFVEESNLFLYLHILRKTLGTQANGNPYLETLRRRGYRFNGDVRSVAALNGQAATLLKFPVVPPAIPVSSDEKNHDLPSADVETIVDSTPRIRLPFLRPVPLVAGLIAIVAVLGFTFFYVGRPQTPITSIAVMPFVTETKDTEFEYLADGMTELLIANLSRVPELSVQARSSVERYKGTSVDARTVGNELNVQAVLYGWIRQQQDTAVIRVELVEAGTGKILWEQRYNRHKRNLVQEEIAGDLVSKLRLPLSGSTVRNLAKKPHSDNADALLLFIKGQMYIRRLTAPEIKLGIGFLEQAIEIDPSYAMAHAGIAEAYRSLALAGEVHPEEALPKAREAALRAVEIDDRLAEGQSGLASAAYLSDWDWTEAEKLYQRALELDPTSASAHMYYADFLFRIGRTDEWRSNHLRASKLEPSSSFINVFASMAFGTPEDPEGSIKRIRAVIESDPDFYFAHLVAGGIYKNSKMYPEALGELRVAKTLSPEQTWSDCGVFEILMITGKVREARKVLKELHGRSRTHYVPPFHFALAYSQLGEKDEAFAYLEEAFRIRDPKLTFLHTDGRLKNLRDDPRFADMSQRMGFPPVPQTPLPPVHSS